MKFLSDMAKKIKSKLKSKKVKKKMNADVGTITINGVEYVKSGTTSDKAEALEGMKYVIVRSQGAGVFAGYLVLKNGTEVSLRKSRRLWYWSGAASLSQLAMEGTKKPADCKFPCEVDNHDITGVLEVLDCTESARKSIASVKVWAQ